MIDINKLHTPIQNLFNMRNSLIHMSRLIGTTSQVSSRSRLNLVNKALYSISHHEQNNGSHGESVHFENTRPEDVRYSATA